MGLTCLLLLLTVPGVHFRMTHLRMEDFVMSNKFQAIQFLIPEENKYCPAIKMFSYLGEFMCKGIINFTNRS